MPPSVNKSNASHYENSPALTEYFEFEGRDHWTCGEPGWETVADYALVRRLIRLFTVEGVVGV
jgi:hypothetical protein